MLGDRRSTSQLTIGLRLQETGHRVRVIESEMRGKLQGDRNDPKRRIIVERGRRTRKVKKGFRANLLERVLVLEAKIRLAICLEHLVAYAVKEIVPQPPSSTIGSHRFEFDERFGVIAVRQKKVHHFGDGVCDGRFRGHSVGRLTESFYDTALNEANDA